MASRDTTQSGATGARGFGRRLTTETKSAFKTTEFWTMIVLVLAILISAAAINGGDNGTDEFIARQAWLYVVILAGAYFISRGLAKSGSRDPYWDRPDTGNGAGIGERVKAAAQVLTEGETAGARDQHSDGDHVEIAEGASPAGSAG